MEEQSGGGEEAVGRIREGEVGGPDQGACYGMVKGRSCGVAS